MPYPISRIMQRSFALEQQGVIHVWDVDKTYLDTHFSSLEGMATIPIEFAVDKRAFPGMPELLRALRWGGEQSYACVPIIFVTASPPQLRKVLARKMLLDGVEWDGIVFKNWLAVLASGYWRRLREQLAFKLCALLSCRLLWPLRDEFLYGDDTESDPEAFALYTRIIHHELSAAQTEVLLRERGVSRPDRRNVHALVQRLPIERGRVRQAFIHLAGHSPLSRFSDSEVLPVRHAAELALALWEREQVRADGCLRALNASLGAFSPVARRRALDEATDRGLISPARAAVLEQDELFAAH
ncbi:MAG: hypothetical protein RBU37_10285 [Myxococcota bacterium]|jgi:hypothetical protein|nr:hypothetical protein [Myxococcota bacterium]